MLDLAADSAVFVSDFGESLRFRASVTSTARTITANVNREPVQDDTAGPYSGSRKPTMHIMCRNNSTLGVTPDEVVGDESEVEVSFRAGGTARWRKVLRVLRQNTGCVLLEVQS